MILSRMMKTLMKTLSIGITYNSTIHFWWLFLLLCSVDCDNIVAQVEVLIMMRQIDFWYQVSVHTKTSKPRYIHEYTHGQPPI